MTANGIFRAALKVYTTGSWARRLMVYGRPYICPFEELIDKVPKGATVLDVGCGDGLFLNILGYFEEIGAGLGFDTNSAAITSAELAKRNLPNGDILQFIEWSVGQPWPGELFDVVSMIDVLHHIPVGSKRNTILEAVAHVKPGGVFLFKDMVDQPKWLAFANSLHDFVLTGEWVSYIPLNTVVSWVEAAGLREERRQVINRLWYGHELVLFRK